jgi:hypothetical protein
MNKIKRCKFCNNEIPISAKSYKIKTFCGQGCREKLKYRKNKELRLKHLEECKKWNKEHAESQKLRAKIYRQIHKDELRDKARIKYNTNKKNKRMKQSYYLLHREEIKLKRKAYYDKNRHYIIDYQKEVRLRNKKQLIQQTQPKLLNPSIISI